MGRWAVLVQDHREAMAASSICCSPPFLIEFVGPACERIPSGSVLSDDVTSSQDARKLSLHAVSLGKKGGVLSFRFKRGTRLLSFASIDSIDSSTPFL